MKNSKLYKIVKEEVKRHVQEAKGGTKFKCNDCGKKFTASLMNFGSRECPKCESPDTALVKEITEANDETDVHKQKGKRPKSFKQASAWDWRIHSKGSYWEFAPNAWGARAKSGQVDYFKDKRVAMKFADYSHQVTNKASDLYVRGSFREGVGQDSTNLSTAGKARLKKLMDTLIGLPDSELRKKRKAINSFIDQAQRNKTARVPGADKLNAQRVKDAKVYLKLVVLAMDTQATAQKYGKNEGKSGVTEMATGLKVECMECGKIFTARSHEPKCPRCGGYDVDIA